MQEFLMEIMNIPREVAWNIMLYSINPMFEDKLKMYDKGYPGCFWRYCEVCRKHSGIYYCELYDDNNKKYLPYTIPRFKDFRLKNIINVVSGRFLKVHVCLRCLYSKLVLTRFFQKISDPKSYSSHIILPGRSIEDIIEDKQRKAASHNLALNNKYRRHKFLRKYNLL